MSELVFARDGCELRRRVVAPDDAERMTARVYQMDLASMGDDRVARGDRHKHRHVRDSFAQLANDNTFAGIDLEAATG